MRALFSLAVRMAQLIGLDDDPSTNFPPLLAEMRRRLWWQLCSLESRGAEEGLARTNSILEDRNVALPANLFDFDLHPDMVECPQSRSGCTDMTFVLIRFETIRTMYRLWKIRKTHAQRSNGTEAADLKSEQRKSLQESKLRFETKYLQYLDQSRPYDWLCMSFAKAMIVCASLHSRV